MDVANSKSYISGSTTTNDLISNIDGTLENGVGYDTDNLGSFVFDGVDDYIDIGNITTGNPLMLNGSELTLCVFVKTESLYVFAKLIS